MGMKRTDEFRADAVRIALTSGLTRWRNLTSRPMLGFCCGHCVLAGAVPSALGGAGAAHLRWGGLCPVERRHPRRAEGRSAARANTPCE